MFSLLYKLVRRCPEIVFLTADNGFPDFGTFKQAFPERFFNLGIAEANMISFAAGMESCGRIPYVFAITPFLTMRAYEQIRDDICIANRNVKLIGVGGGLYYSRLGVTHYTIEDFAILSVLPNMSILCPCNISEMKRMLMIARDIEGPVYIRFNNEVEETFEFPQYDFELGRGVMVKDGDDLTVITTGDVVYEVYMAVKILKNTNISVRIIYMPTIKPLDEVFVCHEAMKTKKVLIIEEHSIRGGLGSIIIDAIVKNNLQNIHMQKMGINDCFPRGYGTRKEMLDYNGLGAMNIKDAIVEMVKQK